MDASIIKKLTECREAISRHRVARGENQLSDEAISSLVALTLEALNGHGFDSLQSFSKWNDEMNFAAYCECRPIEGSCDKCVGYKGTPPCYKKYGTSSCFSGSAPTSLESIRKTGFLLYTAQAHDPALVERKGKRTPCPEGHGWYQDLAKATVPPFDITWRVFT